MIEVTNILDVEKHIGDIEIVIFDLDDTLYPEKSYVRSGYCEVAKCFSHIEDMAEKLWVAFENGELAINSVLNREGLLTEENLAMALEIYRKHAPNIQLYDGVLDMLCNIRSKGKKIGLITDGRPDGQRAKIERLQLCPLLDEIIVTDELGGINCRKPNEISFRIMQQRFGQPFGKMAYVGDNKKKDFIAPLCLGMQCIWFQNPEGLYYLEK